MFIKVNVHYYVNRLSNIVFKEYLPTEFLNRSINVYKLYKCTSSQIVSHYVPFSIYLINIVPVSKQVCQFCRYARVIHFIPNYTIRNRVKSFWQVNEICKQSSRYRYNVSTFFTYKIIGKVFNFLLRLLAKHRGLLCWEFIGSTYLNYENKSMNKE